MQNITQENVMTRFSTYEQKGMFICVYIVFVVNLLVAMFGDRRIKGFEKKVNETHGCV